MTGHGRNWLWLMGLAGVALMPGCGPKLVKPEGRVLENGQPYIRPNDKMLRVTFHPLELAEGFESADEFVASVRQLEGAFYVVGRRGKGIPPGKYKITIKLTTRSGDSDLWKGKFGLERTPFISEVDGSKELILDIGNPAS